MTSSTAAGPASSVAVVLASALSVSQVASAVVLLDPLGVALTPAAGGLDLAGSALASASDGAGEVLALHQVQTTAAQVGEPVFVMLARFQVARVRAGGRLRHGHPSGSVAEAIRSASHPAGVAGSKNTCAIGHSSIVT